MMVSLHLGKNYIGYDVVSEYVQINRERYEKVQKDYPNQSVRLFTGDGCKMENLGDASQEFIFTCPPYFNLEEYKNAPGQLSRLSTYGKFLERINECLVNCFRVLKRDSFMVFVVGDWHRDGKFYCFHNDFISLAKNNKFELWDIVINRVYSPFVVFAMSQNERFKWMGKAHEYILVFKKL
jgi:DNA modification methylase